MTPATPATGRLPGLEALRGVAALLLVIFHIRYIPILAVPEGLGRFIAHCGSGVPLFYAISAFSLMLGYERCLEKAGGLERFFTRRFFRIAPLFYFMLVVWLFIDKFYLHSPVKGRTVLLNAAFCFGFLPGQHEGIVWASWSVGVEWIFYMLFPVFLLLAKNWIRAVILFAVSLAISTNVAPLLAGIKDAAPTFAYLCFPNHLAFFSAGILAFRIVRPGNGSIPKWVSQHGRWLSWAVFAASLGWLWLGWHPNFVPLLYRAHLDVHWAAGGWIGLLVGSAVGLPRLIENAFLRFSGRVSFGLYLMNPPIIFGLSEAGVYRFLYGKLPGSGPAFLTCAAVAMLAVYGAAWAAHRWIEQPGIHLGERLLRRDPATNWTDSFLHIGKAPIWSILLRVLAVAMLVFSGYVAIRYIRQPLADIHAFRQTQTALTAYWMMHEGWSLAYQTPVAGFPWSIPLEFPIYQAIVAAISSLSGFDLDATGRLVSYLFLVACVWPAFAVSRRLDLPKSVPWIFCALLWSSPLHVYWGRTFMIETAALFFSLACIPHAIDIIRGIGGWRSASLFVLPATAAILQKATTGGPVLLFLGFAALVARLRKDGLRLRAWRQLLLPSVAFGIPLTLGVAWAHYADIVKMANPFGAQLTSSVLTDWNFGSLAQRLNPETWRLVVWTRSLVWNAGGLLGLFLLVLPWLGGRCYRKFAWLSLAALGLFILPLLIFTNLHFVHEYYQVGCVAFLLAALAIAIGGWLQSVTRTALVPLLATLAIVAFNLISFKSWYGDWVARTLDELDPRSVQSYKVGRYLREHTRPGSALVVFGQDYSSEVAYQAQRKSMTVPQRFREYTQLWENPGAYVGGLELGAIVLCPPTDEFPTAADLQTRLASEPHWVHESVAGCELLLAPNKEHSPALPTGQKAR